MFLVPGIKSFPAHGWQGFYCEGMCKRCCLSPALLHMSFGSTLKFAQSRASCIAQKKPLTGTLREKILSLDFLCLPSCIKTRK